MSKRQLAEGHCDLCYAPLLWARTPDNTKVALDMRPNKDRGEWVLDDLEMRCVKLDGEMLKKARANGRSLFSNHLRTCEKRNPQMSLLTEEGNGNEENPAQRNH